MNNDELPDHALFPADPLYVLTKLSGQVQAYPHVQPATGLSGSGSFSDALDFTRSFMGIPGWAPETSEIPRRVIKLSNYSGDIATVTMSPSATVTISGTQTGAHGSNSIWLSEVTHPILLSQPDIFGRPHLGDGRNQFVYDSINEGKLLVPTTAAVPPIPPTLTSIP